MIFALVINYFVCTPYRKQLFVAVHNFVHLNLSIALLLGYLVFAVGVELAARNEVWTQSMYNDIHSVPPISYILLFRLHARV